MWLLGQKTESIEFLFDVTTALCAGFVTITHLQTHTVKKFTTLHCLNSNQRQFQKYTCSQNSPIDLVKFWICSSRSSIRFYTIFPRGVPPSTFDSVHRKLIHDWSFTNLKLNYMRWITHQSFKEQHISEWIPFLKLSNTGQSCGLLLCT